MHLLLASATQASDATSLSEAMADAARSEGLTIARVHRPSGVDRAQRLIADAIAVPLSIAGADPLVPEAWAGIDALRELELLLAVEAAWAHAQESGTDVVIVDAGSLPSCVRLAGLPELLLRVCRALRTPRIAIAAASRPGAAASGLDPLDGLSSAMASMDGLARVLQSPSTTVRIATTAIPAEQFARDLNHLALLGVHVDGVVVHPMAGQRDGKEAKRSDRVAASAIATSVLPIATWSSRRRRWRVAPKGRSVLAPADPASPVRIDRLESDDDGFTTLVSMPPALTADAEIGHQGRFLVVRWQGQVRWIDLPSVLTRCTPVDAVRMSGGVQIRWQPDPAVWPAAMGKVRPGVDHGE